MAVARAGTANKRTNSPVPLHPTPLGVFSKTMTFPKVGTSLKKSLS